jgi:hypothetical protein
MTMPGYARELAHRLAREAEAVCRRYLSNGHREGRYWLVGDVKNTPGRSMFVRLKGPETGKGAAGKWTDAHRAAQHHGILSRPGGRAFRPPHRIALASAQRIDGQPSCPDRGDDRQSRLSRREASSRDRGAAARRAKDRLHGRPPLQRSPPDLGQARSGPRQAPGHGAAARRIAEGRRASPPAGPITAKCRRSPSSPTGLATPRPRRSSGTTPCWRCCRSACWLPRAPASRRTSPTKRGGSAFRSGSSAAAAHERRRSSKLLRRYCLASTDRVS